MQKVQISHDAAYKYTLWLELWGNWQSQLEKQGSDFQSNVSPNRRHSVSVNRDIMAFVKRAALPIIRQHLPRRVYEPCCLAGLCGLNSASSDVDFSLLSHRQVHVGRKHICITEGIRDEDCYCLAHSCACLGNDIQLEIHNYHAWNSGVKDPHRGLSCLLSHLELSSIEIWNINSKQDAQGVLREISRFFLRAYVISTASRKDGALFSNLPRGCFFELNSQSGCSGVRQKTTCKRLCLGNFSLTSGSIQAPSTAVALYFPEAAMRTSAVSTHNFPLFVSNSFNMMIAESFAFLLQCMSFTDCATQLQLHNCEGMEDVTVLASYVKGTRRLTSLVLRGMQLSKELNGWKELACAVAGNATLLDLDVSACGWTDAQLRDGLLSNLGGFLPRQGCFGLNISHNALSVQCLCDLVSLTPESFRSELQCLSIAGLQCSDVGENVLATFFISFPMLKRLDVSYSTWASRSIQRILRGMLDSAVEEQRREGTGRPWELVNLSGLTLPLNALRRVTQLCFRGRSLQRNRTYENHNGAHLLLRDVDLHKGAALSKAAFHTCLGNLGEIDFSHCALGDDGIAQLATALDKAASVLPLRLRILRLKHNEIGCGPKNKTEGAFSSFCRVLRAGTMPNLALLDVSWNRIIPLRPTLALIEQISCTLRELDLSYTSLAADPRERALLLTAIMRRQKQPPLPPSTTGASSFTWERHHAEKNSGLSFAAVFEYLDIKCKVLRAEPMMGMRDALDWLRRQTAIRFIE